MRVDRKLDDTCGPFVRRAIDMNASTFPATKLRSAQRIELTIQAMSNSANISGLAVEHQVSCKFVYELKDKARGARDRS